MSDAEDRPTAARLRVAATTATAAGLVPHAYSLTVWSSTAVCAGLHGPPQPFDILGYGGMALAVFVGIRRTGRAVHSGSAARPDWAPALAWGATIGLQWITLAHLPAPAAWPVAGMLTSAGYFATIAIATWLRGG